MNQDEWRAELLRIYDEAYARKHPPGTNGEPDTGGVRVPRKPKPTKPSGAMALEEPIPVEAP